MNLDEDRKAVLRGFLAEGEALLTRVREWEARGADWRAFDDAHHRLWRLLELFEELDPLERDDFGLRVYPPGEGPGIVFRVTTGSDPL